MDKDDDNDNVEPGAEEATEFLNDIWGNTTEHKKDADWLKKIKVEIGTGEQIDMTIDLDKLRNTLKRMPNWTKAPGPDLVQGFWLKHFTSLHERIAEQLHVCLERGQTPT